MKILKYLFPLIILFSISVQAQFDNSIYYSRNNYSLTSPGAMKYGLYGYVNPAILSTVDHFDVLFTWSNRIDNKNLYQSLGILQQPVSNDIDSWGFFTAIPHLGFSVLKNNYQGDLDYIEYQISGSFGNDRFSFGAGFNWSYTNIARVLHPDIFTLGTMFRPNRYLSGAIIGFIPTSGNKEAALELAVRPFGNEIVSLFGDYVLSENDNPILNDWSAGIAVEPLAGIRLTGRYFENEMFDLGVQIGLGKFGVTSKANTDKELNRNTMVYGIRFGEYDRNIINQLAPKDNYVDLNLLGETKYRRFRLFDDSNTLSDLLLKIDAAKYDDKISGIAINTSGMSINREMLWELREKFKEFKSTGKKVVIYFDRTGIDGYHFISVADKIVMDPVGQLTLEGYLIGRTYYTGTLEKLGIGFNEWRYFKYKSALESFSETDMTEADREQRQALVDDYYFQAKTDICNGRNIDQNDFDNLVDNVTFFLPEDAVEYGLADTIGRWNTVKDIVNEFEGESQDFVSSSSLDKFKLPDDNYWGVKPKIAVIYALGVCAMDEGITTRRLVKDVKRACNDDNTKAIVFRVDSPGGDGLASDIVAEALKECNKPVIVSQGYVAASGGYWLSMYADTIVAAPTTITGSIGVIGGWYYNKDLKEEIGVTTDYVKRGKHADLEFGFSFPLIGTVLPDRNLTDDEMEKVGHSIKTMYKEFVTKVAKGRDMQYEEIEKIAQGRVWSGIDGKDNGLVDVLGGLDYAINIAVERANLSDKEYEIYELPSQPLFNLNIFTPSIFGFDIEKENKMIEHLKFRFKNNGLPLPILPIEDMNMIN